MVRDYLEVPIPYFWVRDDEDEIRDIEIKSTPLALKELMNFMMKNSEELGTHYVVTTEGDIIQCVEPESKIKFDPGIASPGIVGVIVAGEASDKQLEGLLKLCINLCSDYTISLRHVSISIEGFPEFEFLNSLGSGIIDSLIHAVE